MFKNLLSKRDEGFTLVEIVIVLAIVGLIFVIIFLAVTAAQRGQRDTARKDNVNRAVAGAQQLLGNSQTVTVGSCAATCASIMSGSVAINPPITSVNTAVQTTDLTIMSWVADAAATKTDACYDADATHTYGTQNGGTTAAFGVKLEGGGYYCKDY